MSESEAEKQAITEMERIASQTARDRANSGRWDLDVAVALFAVLILVVFLLFGGASTTIVAPIAIFGLLIAWLMGWRKGRQLYSSYYIEEFRKLGVQYTDDLQLKRPVGCDKCNDTGYSGRTGLHEVLEGTDEIKRMIMQKDLVEEIRRHAIKEGMTTLKQDGILKIFKGDCDLKQVLAVCIV